MRFLEETKCDFWKITIVLLIVRLAIVRDPNSSPSIARPLPSNPIHPLLQLFIRPGDFQICRPQGIKDFAGQHVEIGELKLH